MSHSSQPERKGEGGSNDVSKVGGKAFCSARNNDESYSEDGAKPHVGWNIIFRKCTFKKCLFSVQIDDVSHLVPPTLHEAARGLKFMHCASFNKAGGLP